MQRCLVLIVALGFFSPTPIARAQQASTAAANDESALPQPLENGTILYLQLSKSLDAGKARVGDEVHGFLLADVVSHGKIAARRNSKLIGHITEAQAHTKENPESRLGIAFDRIVPSHGQEIPIASVLLALRPSLRLQTEPPPVMGPRGPNSMGSNQSDLSYPALRGSASKLHARMGPDFDTPVNTRVQTDMELLEIEGLSLQATPDGSNKIVVSRKRTVKLESRMRMELRVEKKPQLVH